MRLFHLATVASAVLVLASGCASVPAGKYYWLHPKGDMRLLDKKTHAPERVAAPSSAAYVAAR